MSIKILLIGLMTLIMLATVQAVIIEEGTAFLPSESNITHIINQTQSGVTTYNVNPATGIIDSRVFNASTGAPSRWQILQNPTTLMSINNDDGNDWTHVGDTTLTINGTETNLFDSDMTYNLYLDNVNKTNPFTETYSQGEYSIKYNVTYGYNYTNGAITQTLTIFADTGNVTGVLCRYTKFGYYNKKLPFMTESGCIS